MSSMKNDPPEIVRTKTIIFWWVYVLDKGLSLRLGRASTIQDYDIDVLPYLEENVGGHLGAHHCYMVASIDIARIEGKLYDQLYSASSFSTAPDVRERRAYDLIEELSHLQIKLADARVSHIPNPILIVACLLNDLRRKT